MNAVTAEATVDIDAPRSEVWRSITDPEKIREYYLEEARRGRPEIFRLIAKLDCLQVAAMFDARAFFREPDKYSLNGDSPGPGHSAHALACVPCSPSRSPKPSPKSNGARPSAGCAARPRPKGGSSGSGSVWLRCRLR